MDSIRYLTAADAAARLGVQTATLYAYVSRGLVRSAGGADGRQRRYHAADIERLAERKAQRRDPGRAAQKALNAGMPVMDSGIALLTDQALYYRGHDVVRLAHERTVEEVAALIWTGSLDGEVPGLTGRLPGDCSRWLRSLNSYERIEAMQVLLPMAGAGDLAAYDRRPEAMAATGARILRLLATAAAGCVHKGGVVEGLQQAWARRRPGVVPLLHAALILCADHELNASAFTARCVASTGATPYAAVGAGLAALSGPRHGGSAHRVAALLDEAAAVGAKEAVARRLRQGEGMPGFGHVVYSGLDPRAGALFELLQARFPKDRQLALGRAVADEVGAVLGQQANIDLALGVLMRLMGRSPGDGVAFFGVGRSIGWIGHVMEEYARGELIRPRARYTGPLPEGV